MKNTSDMKPFPFMMVVLFLTAWACKHEPKNENTMQPVRVRLVQVTTREISLPIRTGGIVTSSQEIRLSFKTGGIIGRMDSKEGQRVSEGYVMASLDLSEMEAQLNQARNGYEKASRDFTRVRNLYADSVATLEQMQNAETVMNVSKSTLDLVEFNLAHSMIRAPANGIILKRLAEPNEVVAPGYPVFLFGTEGKSWKIRTGLADRDFVRLRSGDSARVTLDAYPDDVFRAVVSQVSESANPMTGTYEVELDLVSGNRKLASGFMANLEMYPSQKRSCSLVPVGAIVQAEGQAGYIFVVGDSLIAHKREIKIEAILGAEAAITGIPGNVSAVVAGGAAYLKDGDKVEIAK